MTLARTTAVTLSLLRLGRLARTRRIPILPSLVILAAVLAATLGDILLVGPLLPEANTLGLENFNAPPIPFPESTLSHPLGTDRLGRDVLSRLLVGAKFSMAVGILTVTLASITGTAAGVIAGYAGGWAERILMRIVDIMLSFPAILVALALVVTIGPSFWLLVIVLGLQLWPQFARLSRASVLVWKNAGFVLMSRVIGASPLRTIVKHILPNVLNGIVVLATLQIGWVMVAEAGLSFLGAGIPPPTPSWGNMLADGREGMRTAWWLTVVPGLAITLVVLSFNILGDWLRDTLDPYLRQLEP